VTATFICDPNKANPAQFLEFGMKVTITFEADVQDVDMASLQDFVDGINHKDTVKIYSERLESEYEFGSDDAEEGEEYEEEGEDAEAEEGEGVEDEQTDQ
jgi:hypothetical protein